MQGPGIFLAQFMSDQAPFDTLANIAQWAASQGYRAIQIPTLGTQCIDLERAAESQVYCDELIAICADAGVVISELSTHLQGQLVAVHPAFDDVFDSFAPQHLRGNPRDRTEWAVSQLKLAAQASQRLGLKAHATFSGSLLWPFLYPWPQRPAGLVDQGFAELARRWLPILDCYEEAGVDLCYEIHPGEDLHDGASFERFLQAVNYHPRAAILYDPSHLLLQQMDYLGFIDRYHDRIRMFHVKDAEFRPNARSGVYGGYQGWTDRPGRFRSLGDGQVDFKSIFSKLTQYDYEGWAILEWECCLKDSAQGALEGAAFIQHHLINKSRKAFDDFASVTSDEHFNRLLLGLLGD
ncbi:sugar phosphate isomerase/epimerase [Pseudomonas graminis]|uniref:sugar phosphate isomerase/epimerase family protein n=1 Tax=Pseudomonas graminis TaxID=158627 RepID=UPI00234AB4CA|nr:sugar phosphate isomerase/epimerase [Pseudomonas graminis]MDC6378961.1 sugar phosphate isomerase/epimerase [Pseudomonas graminis]